ncbi:MAG: hypothetical protein ACFFAH_08125 [Promethearchaeota archaeon]
MDIKKLRFFLLLLILLICIIFYTNPFPVNDGKYDNIIIEENNANLTHTNFLKLSDVELPDKVYTFLAPSDTLNFELYLEKEYIYTIYIELVTPHNVTMMRIRIWDPNNEQYTIFESEMFYDPEFGRYFEVPFGTAISGDYDIQFYTLAPLNFNMHILIEQGPKCLYDKMELQETNNIEFYEVKHFGNGDNVEHDVELETDTMYKFYIGRVSAISITQSNETRANYYIEDPNGVEFEIYNNEFIAGVDSVNFFSFGTAVAGEYTIKLTVYCNVQNVNIAYAIVKEYEIGEVVDANETEPVKETSFLEEAEKQLNDEYSSLPFEAVIWTLAFAGIVAGIALVALITHKKRKAVSLYIKKKNK